MVAEMNSNIGEPSLVGAKMRKMHMSLILHSIPRSKFCQFEISMVSIKSTAKPHGAIKPRRREAIRPNAAEIQCLQKTQHVGPSRCRTKGIEREGQNSNEMNDNVIYSRKDRSTVFLCARLLPRIHHTKFQNTQTLSHTQCASASLHQHLDHRHSQTTMQCDNVYKLETQMATNARAFTFALS